MRTAVTGNKSNFFAGILANHKFNITVWRRNFFLINIIKNVRVINARTANNRDLNHYITLSLIFSFWIKLFLFSFYGKYSCLVNLSFMLLSLNCP
ncbi:hypothetical protein SDC9_159802 [bioreactor metagenome]|uniref:Uncharacterized protein n=1 Tax=bioreactor metagenome TaxID=1076179 RepID=A0A645FJ69_9ZZZZ